VTLKSGPKHCPGRLQDVSRRTKSGIPPGIRCGNPPYLVSMPGVGPAPFFITQQLASVLPQVFQV
jgi:hypothetical protein